jgi:hypothetical protein
MYVCVCVSAFLLVSLCMQVRGLRIRVQWEKAKCLNPSEQATPRQISTVTKVNPMCVCVRVCVWVRERVCT